MLLWSVVDGPISLRGARAVLGQGHVSVPRRPDLVSMRMERVVGCELRERCVIRHAG